MLGINAPLGSLAELNAVSEAGASELYCGIVPEGASSKAEADFVNRRPTREGNLSSYEELAQAVLAARAKGLRVSFTLNEPFSPESHYPFLLAQAEQAVEAGVDTIIVADPVLMSLIHERGLPVRIHVSAAASCLNSATVTFFRSLGATRVILPRHLLYAEIAAMVRQHPDLEFEVIVLGDPCAWDDGLCTMEHNLHLIRPERPFMGGLCSVMCQEVKVRGAADAGEEDAIRSRYLNQLERHRGCGLCALWDLKAMGITHVKSTGRDNAQMRLRYVGYLSATLSLLEDPTISRDEFIKLATDLRSRMFNEFVTREVVELARRIPSPTKLGTGVREVLMHANLLACDPPWGCYFPEAVIRQSDQFIESKTILSGG